jgi:muramidase (phage lysozyme)
VAPVERGDDGANSKEAQTIGPQSTGNTELGVQLAADGAARARTAPANAPVQQPSGYTTTPATRLAAANAYLRDPNVRALLNTISRTEGAGYNTLSGRNLSFNNFSTFPPNGLAAGRYQIEPGTYGDLSTKLGLKDFSPRTQDLMAVQLLIDKSAIDAAVAGNLDEILKHVNDVWASLPQSQTGTGHYNDAAHNFQRAKPYADVRAIYDEELARDRSIYP